MAQLLGSRIVTLYCVSGGTVNKRLERAAHEHVQKQAAEDVPSEELASQIRKRFSDILNEPIGDDIVKLLAQLDGKAPAAPKSS